MKNLTVKIKFLEHSFDNTLKKGTKGSSGYDLRACTSLEVSHVNPMERVLIPCGFCLEMPSYCEAQIRPRSGLALKHGITCLNAPGTIDADYRGEIKVLLINLGHNKYILRRGERIAQVVFIHVANIDVIPSDNISSSRRNTGGFGSTGKH